MSLFHQCLLSILWNYSNTLKTLFNNTYGIHGIPYHFHCSCSSVLYVHYWWGFVVRIFCNVWIFSVFGVAFSIVLTAYVPVDTVCTYVCVCFVQDAEDKTALYRVEEDGVYTVKVATISELEPIELNSSELLPALLCLLRACDTVSHCKHTLYSSCVSTLLVYTHGYVAYPFPVSITLMNPTGYLDAADYPAMVFYSVMLVVYVSLAVVWSVLLCCSYKDLIRLQVCVCVCVWCVCVCVCVVHPTSPCLHQLRSPHFIATPACSPVVLLLCCVCMSCWWWLCVAECHLFYA